MEEIEKVILESSQLNNLKEDPEKLFVTLNNSLDVETLNQITRKYEPQRSFQPVKLLRYIVANELEKGKEIDSQLIKDVQKAIESREVSEYVDLNANVKKSLNNYKQSKKGMFPNWKTY